MLSGIMDTSGADAALGPGGVKSGLRPAARHGLDRNMIETLRPRLMTLGVAAAGTAVFLAAGLPLPVLLGPMFGCLAAAFLGVPMMAMGIFGTAMRTFLGVAIGTAVTPELVHNLPREGATLLLIPLFVLLIGLACYPFLRRVFGYDHATAFYSAMPGGLQDMLIFGEQAGGNVRAMSLIHATRVLTIVTIAPLLLASIYDLDLTRPPGAQARDLPAWQIGLMIAAGLAGWWAAEKVKLFGASILGPLILTAILSLTGIITTRPPAEMIWVAQFFIGIAVGARYAGITGRELRHDVGAGLALSLAMGLISAAVIQLALAISPAGTLDVWLAFLPGGQAEMVMIAIVAGGDVAYVVTHHLLRILTVILSAPIVARYVMRRE
jgi:membrane AbrB-like protein